MIKWLRFGCMGSVRSQTSLPASGQPADRYVVLYDTSATGGRAALSGQMATIPGTVAEPTVWEFRTGAAGEAGWGRIAVGATPPTHCQKVMILSQHYLNYSAGGDTLATPYPTFDDVTGIRSKQIAAASAEGAVYVDQYNYFRSLITSGVETQGSASVARRGRKRPPQSGWRQLRRRLHQ